MQIVGGALADRAAMQLVADSNGALARAIDRLSDIVEQFAEEQERRDWERDHTHEIADLRRQIDRLASAP